MEKLWEEIPEEDKVRIRKTLEYNDLNIYFLNEVFHVLGKGKEFDSFGYTYEKIIDIIFGEEQGEELIRKYD